MPLRDHFRRPVENEMKSGSSIRVMVGGCSRRSTSSALPTRTVPGVGGHSSPKSPRSSMPCAANRVSHRFAHGYFLIFLRISNRRAALVALPDEMIRR
jgi:hypothetical protein